MRKTEGDDTEEDEDDPRGDFTKESSQCPKKMRDNRGEEGAIEDATSGDPRSTQKRNYSIDNGDDGMGGEKLEAQVSLVAEVSREPGKTMEDEKEDQKEGFARDEAAKFGPEESEQESSMIGKAESEEGDEEYLDKSLHIDGKHETGVEEQ